MPVSKLDAIKGLPVEQAMKTLNDANHNNDFDIVDVRNDSFVTADMRMNRIRVYYDPITKIVTEAYVG